MQTEIEHDLQNARQQLAEGEAELAEFNEWKRTKPDGVWMHRSAGAWAKNKIAHAKRTIRELESLRVC